MHKIIAIIISLIFSSASIAECKSDIELYIEQVYESSTKATAVPHVIDYYSSEIKSSYLSKIAFVPKKQVENFDNMWLLSIAALRTIKSEFRVVSDCKTMDAFVTGLTEKGNRKVFYIKLIEEGSELKIGKLEGFNAISHAE